MLYIPTREWHGFSNLHGLRSQVGTVGIPLVYLYPQQGLAGLGGSSNSNETNTFQDGLWHITTTLFLQPPQPSMIGHEDPPPWSRNGNDHPPMFTGAQHHHRCMAMIALHDLWQLATRTHHCDNQQVPTNSHEGPPPPSMNGHEGPPPWSMADNATMTNEWPWGPFTTNGKVLPPQSMNGYQQTHHDQCPTMSDVHGAHQYDQWMATMALHH